MKYIIISVVCQTNVMRNAAGAYTENVQRWALDSLCQSYLCPDYDFTNYWRVAEVQKLSNSALELHYRLRI